jgi:predicted ATPase with chaperone activity
MSGKGSLAHYGILFLDKLPEFRSYVLTVLRRSMEKGIVTIARTSKSMICPGLLPPGKRDYSLPLSTIR